MNALVKKEIRLLLPAWIAAMLLAVASVVLTTSRAGIIYFIEPIDLHVLCLLLGATVLGIASFGQEFTSGGFTLLLSQPVERRWIWLVKAAVLAVAFLSVLFTLLGSWELFFLDVHSHGPPLLKIWKSVGFTALWAFALFSGGLWTTLLLRQMTGAFWLTLLTPLAIVFGISVSLEAFISSDPIVNTAAFIGLALYAVAGILWSRRLFLRAQDFQWTGGTIGLPSRKAISEQVVARPRHRLAALFGKELQLNQANFLVAGLVLVLHLASVVARKVHPHFTDRNVEYILEMVWGLWLLMPLLIGSAAVAEERKLGVLESQLCLPVSRRVQLAVKFFVGLVLSLILGAVMPLAIEFPQNLLALTRSGLPFFVVAAAIYFVSFYASTLTRSVPQALGIAIALPAVVGACLMGLAQWLLRTQRFPGEYGGRTILAILIGCPVLVLVVAWLAAGNFNRLHEQRKLWRRNATAVVAAFVFSGIMTNAVYFRAWELLTPFKLSHGPARMSASNPPKLILSGDTLSAILPDGRLWVETLAYNLPTRRNSGLYTLALGQSQAQFVGGSNWTDIAPGWFETAVQSNGSFWCVPKTHLFSGGEQRAQIGKPIQIGSQTNWCGVAGGMFVGGGVLVLQRDGTLWNWETNWARTEAQMLSVQLATPPVQIGHETNWAEVFSSGQCACAKKSDGSVWIWQPAWTNAAFHLVRATNSNFVVDYAHFHLGDNANQLSGSAEVRVDGDLWLSWYRLANNVRVGQGKVHLAQGSKWKAVAFDNRSLLALRDDGTLWRWTPLQDLTRDPRWVKPAQVGSYSDWIALGGQVLYPGASRAVALAADGSLWAWGNPSGHIWLAPSRQPVFLGNIFQGQKK